MESLRKIRHYPYNSYAILWFVFCTLVIIVPLVALTILIDGQKRLIAVSSPKYTNTSAPCLFTPKSVRAGNATTIISSGASGQIFMTSAFGGEVYNLGVLSQGDVKRIVIPPVVPTGLYVVKVGDASTGCKSPLGEDLSIAAADGFSCEDLDLNNNGKIDLPDALPILEHFGENDKKYDVNADGAVDVEDALLVRQSVGKTC